MTAKDEILTLINQYAFTVDGGDMEAFSQLYANAEWSVLGTDPYRGAQEITDKVLSGIIIYEDGTPKTRHVTSNVEISVDEGKGTATAQRYVTVLQGTDTFPIQIIFSGHYHDEFVHEAGSWRYARTVVHGPIFGDMSQHLRTMDFAG